jgi:hypothetical protein
MGQLLDSFLADKFELADIEQARLIYIMRAARIAPISII